MIEAGHIYNGTELEEYQQEVRELTRKYETAMRERYSLDRHVKRNDYCNIPFYEMHIRICGFIFSL